MTPKKVEAVRTDCLVRPAEICVISSVATRFPRTALAGLTFLFFAALTAAGPLFAQVRLDSATRPATFTRAFFGIHVHNNGTTRYWPALPFGSIRLWDSRVNWRDLQPVRGYTDYKRLDEYVSWAERNQVEILYPLWATPGWAAKRPNEEGSYGPGSASEPRSMEDWDNFVDAVSKRYKGRISAYQIGNEVNHRSFYSGSRDDLVEMVRRASRIIKKNDPAAIVVMPSAVGLDKRIEFVSEVGAVVGKSAADVASFHLYHGDNPPEALIPVLNDLTSQWHRSGLQGLWNTEVGYMIQDASIRWTNDEEKYVLDEGRASSQIPKLMLFARLAGFERFYWYAWDSKKYGFIDPANHSMRRTALVLGQFMKLFTGASVESCVRKPSAVWDCELRTSNGKRAAVMWVDARTGGFASVGLPYRGHVIQLDGVDVGRIATSNWQLSSMPVLNLED